MPFPIFNILKRVSAGGIPTDQVWWMKYGVNATVVSGRLTSWKDSLGGLAEFTVGQSIGLLDGGSYYQCVTDNSGMIANASAEISWLDNTKNISIAIKMYNYGNTVYGGVLGSVGTAPQNYIIDQVWNTSKIRVHNGDSDNVYDGFWDQWQTMVITIAEYPTPDASIPNMVVYHHAIAEVTNCDFRDTKNLNTIGYQNQLREAKCLITDYMYFDRVLSESEAFAIINDL